MKTIVSIDNMVHLFLITSFLSLAACGDSYQAPAGGQATVLGVPSANAGVDQTVNEGSQVSLSGGLSADTGGVIVRFQWSQSSGPAVLFTNTTSANPSFIAPSVTTPTELTFSLVVIDNVGYSSPPDTIKVVVNPAVTTVAAVDIRSNTEADTAGNLPENIGGLGTSASPINGLGENAVVESISIDTVPEVQTLPEPDVQPQLDAENEAENGANGFILADGISVTSNLPEFEPHEANEGAFEGGLTGTLADTRIDLAVSEEVQRGGGGGFNIPTGVPPSPLFDATPFTQQMLRFEEFGPEPLPAEEDIVRGGTFPRPVDPQSGPVGIALDNFLAQDIFPFPSRLANTAELNPWKEDIEDFLGRELLAPPAEGRPPGELWSHQRYNEFFPKLYYKTAQAGARVNGGLRDRKQLHRYEGGEFGPGGLYHNTAGAPGLEGTTAGIEVNFAGQFMPVQEPNSLFTFDGTLPPKLLMVRYGEELLMRHYNALPIDPSANNGFGLHTITTHEHNGHTPAESDGYTQAFFFPGQFFDYRWPLQLAGYDSINTDAADPRAGRPDGNGGITKIRGDFRETMSSHWFHDHMLDFTAQNVYKGNAAMMNYYSAIDRANEAVDDGINLRFPSGSALDWGNRDYDVNLMIADKAWDASGQLFFNIFNTDGFLGDQVLTNWLYKPYMEVRARKYRLRLLNGAVSRLFKIAFVTEHDERVPFYMIANDGNIMEHAIFFPDGVLPTQGIAERYDIIIDFAQYEPGTRIYLANLMEHKNGRGPEAKPVSLEAVLSGAYKPVVKDGAWTGGDPGVGKFMELRIVGYSGVDQSMNPADNVPGKQKMLEQPKFSDEELASAIHRTFEFGRSNGTDAKPWTIKTDGSAGLNMDPRRLSAAPNLDGGVEIWHLSTGGGWSHPIHIHFEEGKILSRDGKLPPKWEQFARKDMYRIGNEVDSSQEIDIALRFREFGGTYMEHCHNTQHEDTAMLLRWDIEKPGQMVLLPTPMPTWDGVTYVDSVGLPTIRTGTEDLGFTPVAGVPNAPDVNSGAVSGSAASASGEVTPQ